ncbi:DUF3047 domain-containing protein [Tropicimonas sp. S265A]|uniref:DUF3047 domain-containing protein n=1 Tax=Tropicimonas sp. S265A TaxID=3415134 RepID=UPI003C7ED18C
MRAMILASALALSSFSALAEPVPFDGAWKTQRFSLFSSNTYRFQGATMDVLSDGSVSMAYRQLDPGQWDTRGASWDWSVVEGVDPTDLTRKGGDDRNLAMYFVFLPRAEAEALRGSNIRKLLQNEQARVLVYVWGGDHARNQQLDSPYLGARGKTVVLRAAGTGSHRESVDLARDYARAFGGQVSALVGLAVSADSDDTDGAIRARIGALRLE